MQHKLRQLLIDYGLTIKQARKAVSVVLTTLKFNEPDWYRVYIVLTRQDGFDGANDQMSIAQLASEFMRVYCAERSHTTESAVVAMDMWVGDQRDYALGWLRDHGYVSDKGYEVRA